MVWEDCIADQNGWMGREDLLAWGTVDLPFVHTVGFLVSEDKRFILIAGSVSADESHSFAEVQKIPRGAIHSIRILEELSIEI